MREQKARRHHRQNLLLALNHEIDILHALMGQQIETAKGSRDRECLKETRGQT